MRKLLVCDQNENRWFYRTVHRLVYRITLVLHQPMNTTTKQIEQHRFRWHQASDVLNVHGNPVNNVSAAATTHIIKGVHFIRDVNCESTIHAIRRSLLDGVEFCVHSEPLSAIHTDKHINNQADNPPESRPDNQKQIHDSGCREDAYLQCMSSGSDGKPKRIRRTHQSWITSFLVTKEEAGISSADSYAIVGRASHSLALYAILEAAWIGANVHALADLRPDKQFDVMAQLKSSVLYATPTQLRLLCHCAKQSAQSNAYVQRIFCGGGKLDTHTASLLVKHFPKATVKEFYGASETSFITISDATTPIESVGGVYPHVQLKVMPFDSETDVADSVDQGQIGEIWVKSPYLFEHYSDGSGHEARWHNGFLCIGETGYVDQRNNLYLTGRRSRMVNVADNMVSPEQVENLLNNHRAVKQCAVIAADDATRGSVLIAIVELYKNVESNENEPVCQVANPGLKSELLKTCRRQLGTLKAPRDIIFSDDLPVLASGKPDIRTIEKQFGRT